jgi:periplasmic copper chaperone A
VFRVAICLLLAVALGLPSALAHSHRKRGIEVVHPWTFAASATGGTAQVFMRIRNLSNVQQRLVAASTAAAAMVELHAPAGDGGPAATKPLAAIVIEPGSEVELASDGPHLVLRGVRARLDAYDTFKLTLVFEKAGRIVVDVLVEEATRPLAH